MKAKRAGLYVRVSTEDQHTESQERQLNEYVERRGWKLHKIYREKMSGATVSRPGLDELLKDCRRRAIQVVVVWKFDRCTVFENPNLGVGALSVPPVGSLDG